MKHVLRSIRDIVVYYVSWLATFYHNAVYSTFHLQTIARSVITTGADGLFIETHPNPSEAKSDGANMLKLDKLESIIEVLVRIREAVIPF